MFASRHRLVPINGFAVCDALLAPTVGHALDDASDAEDQHNPNHLLFALPCSEL
jgi:hypothetical protein